LIENNSAIVIFLRRMNGRAPVRNRLNSKTTIGKRILQALVCLLIAYFSQAVHAQSTASSAVADAIQILELQGDVQIQPAGKTVWQIAQTNQPLHAFDHIRTAENSRVALRWSDQSIVPFGASTELEILPPDSPGSQSGLHLIRGVISFFHRDQPGRIHIITRGAVAGVEGTEFLLAVDDADATTLSVVDGKVRFGNDQATLVLTNGQQAVAELGKAPAQTTGFIANNLLQWCFYYPAVLDPDELSLTDEEQKNLTDSLAAYRSGDLQMALAKFSETNSSSDAVKVYHAALLLSVGEVAKTETILSGVDEKSGRPQQLATALRQLIAAVKRQPSVMTGSPQLASEMLADSYFEQSRAVRETSLRNALHLAEQAVTKSPKFGFAWERLAELQFSFGEMRDALKSLDRSLALSPRNAQALALKGFILNAQNEPRAALAVFNEAIATDAALANAWLGRGIVRIRLRDMAGGREDLLVAAALEPQRAELRSYLGKAYVATGDDAHATKELDLAKKLDPKDPTAWLYSALQKQQDNQVNDAIRDLEKSQQLNNNRSVYRSQLLLDQDQAVRAADLASIYADAGMTDVSRQEAGRAVSYDYANYSSHLFLGSSYDQLRDPNWSNLRYESAANTEFTIANLLAPGSAGVLNSMTAQQPYTKLFDQNRVGVASDTTYLSRGTWLEKGSQFGVYDNVSYSFDASYLSDNGQRANNDNERRFLALTVKDQFTSQDSAFFKVEQGKFDSGDVNQYYNQANAFGNPAGSYRFDETQQPNFYFGYHHEWGPGSHTLFYASRQVGYETASGSNVLQEIGYHSTGVFLGNQPLVLDQLRVRINPTLNSTELQQILQTPDHTTIIGTRFQWGDVHYQNYETAANDDDAFDFLTYPVVADQDFSENFYHYTAYGYHTWQITDPFSVTVGLDYDWLHKPANVSTAPFTEQEQAVCQISPKAGFIWQPLDKTTLRGAYTHQLSGFANGQSTKIEPTEVAGFNQAYRSLAPESVVGDSSGSKFDTFDLSLEQKFDTGTYLSVAGQLLYSELNNVQGDFVSDYRFYSQPEPIGFNKAQDFHEQSLIFTADQLLGKQWSAGLVYRLSRAKLDVNYVNFNPAVMTDLGLNPPFQPYSTVTSVLNTLNLHANWNHPCGLFSIFSADWVHQDNFGFTPSEPGDDFWQFNAYAGYRMFKRRVEFTVGLLNIFDQNYSLEPLNLHNDTARSRTFLARLRINF
jgi:Tfp pilus assembly protein PilF